MVIKLFFTYWHTFSSVNWVTGLDGACNKYPFRTKPFATLNQSWTDFIHKKPAHYSGIIMGSMASQITKLTIVYSTVYSGADQRKRQSSASLAFVRGIHQSPVNSPYKWSVMRKMFPFDDVIMNAECVSMSWCLHDKIRWLLPSYHTMATCDWSGADFVFFDINLSRTG